MKELAQEKFIPYQSDNTSLTHSEIDELLQYLPEWQVMAVEGVSHLKRSFDFKNFAEALAFTNLVGEIAEHQGHHPLITLTWGKVTVEWWTHDLQGLHKNDFIMAAKTNQAYL